MKNADNKTQPESIDTSKILKFILDHLDKGTIDEVFNENSLDTARNVYDIAPFFKISVEMLNDIKSNPAHYLKFISA